MKNYLLFTVISLIILGISVTTKAQSIASTITGLSHPESVVADGGYLYVGNVGNELQPSAKDGDGFISKIDLETGEIEQAHFLPNEGATLNAPKGLTISNNTLYLADIDRVVGFDLDSGDMVFELNIPEASFLNDVAVKDSNTLMVSATNIGKIAQVNIPDKSYHFLDIPTIDGANGLDFSADKSTLYCVGYDQTKGEITQITLDPLSSQTLSDYKGLLDGAQISDGQLYFSDWKSSGKHGIINSLDLSAQKVSKLDLNELMGGPADFYLDAKSQTLYVPAMLESIIYVIKL